MTSSSAPAATPVDFWFDPSCPWAWMTSRWVDEVAPLRDLDVTWHVMSLAMLNENNEMSVDRQLFFARALAYARVVTAASELHGTHIVKPLYEALGERIHPGARTDVPEVIAEALAELGLPADVAAYQYTDEFDVPLRASHNDGISRVGQDVGTPVIAVGGSAFFGPVISPAPRGDQAIAVWDAVVALAGFDGFFELKRSRTRGPDFS